MEKRPLWVQALILSGVLVVVVVCYVIFARRRATMEAWTPADEVLPPQLRQSCKFFLTSLMRFSDNAVVWKDMSEHTDPPLYVDKDSNAVVSRDFAFSSPTSYDEDVRAVRISGVKLTGPLSMNLDIYANDRFTFVWRAYTDSEPAGEVIVFETFANTNTNLGFRIKLKTQANPDGSKLHKVVVEHCLDTEPKTCSWTVQSLLGDHTVALVHDGNRRMKLFVDNALKTETDPEDKYANGVESVIYSNKPCVINSSMNWDARLVLAALYRTELTEGGLKALDDYVVNQRTKMSAAYQELEQEREAAEKKRRCLFDDKTICSNECANVTDWTNILAVGRDASVTCRQRILDHCAQNFDSNACACLRETDSSDMKCSAIRAFFENNTKTCSISQANDPVAAGNEPSLTRYTAFSLAGAPAAAVAATAAAPSLATSTLSLLSSSLPSSVLPSALQGEPVIQEVFKP